MAVSDNVLNAAFTDAKQAEEQIPTFLSMLTYTSRPVTHWLLPHQTYKYSKHHLTQVYAPPLEEFMVMATYMDEVKAHEVLKKVNGPTIGIIKEGKLRIEVAGESLVLDAGGTFYVVPDHDVSIRLVAGKRGEVWWAACMV